MRTFQLLLLIVISSCILYVNSSFPWGSNNYNQNDPGNRRVLLTDIKVLTFEEGRYTNARRTSAIPSLSCLGGSAKNSEYKPTTVQCTNVGTDGVDVQWECKADLNSEVKFGKTEVSCEGYEYPNDPFILAGSCGLEYTLEYVNPRQNSYGYGQNNYGHNTYGQHQEHHSTSKWQSILIFAVVAFILYNLFKRFAGTFSNQNPGYGSNYPHSSTNYGNGGYPNNNNNNNYPPGGNSGFPGYPKPNTYGQTYSQPTSQSTFQPGFWGGMGGGGLLGYLLGRSTRPSYGSYGGFGSPRYSSGFGGSSFSSGFGGGSSSGSRTASGFGGTRRR